MRPDSVVAWNLRFAVRENTVSIPPGAAFQVLVADQKRYAVKFIVFNSTSFNLSTKATVDANSGIEMGVSLTSLEILGRDFPALASAEWWAFSSAGGAVTVLEVYEPEYQ